MVSGFALACASVPRPAPVRGVAAAGPLQVLFRAEASEGSERVNLRLTLRLWRSERFELAAADAFGRRVWSLAVAGDEALWIDARRGARCRFAAGEGARLGGAELPLPSRSVPRVLLGALPVEPPLEAGSSAATARAVGFDDDAGRRWRVTRDGAGGVVGWQVTTGEGARLSWEREGARQRLRASEPRFEIAWREVARERLAAPEPPWEAAIPDVPECGDEDLP